jgi:hypothetical protein
MMEDKAEYILELKYGSLILNELNVPYPKIKEIESFVTLEGEEIEVQISKATDIITLLFHSIMIIKGQKLKVSISPK